MQAGSISSGLFRERKKWEAIFLLTALKRCLMASDKRLQELWIALKRGWGEKISKVLQGQCNLTRLGFFSKCLEKCHSQKWIMTVGARVAMIKDYFFSLQVLNLSSSSLFLGLGLAFKQPKQTGFFWTQSICPLSRYKNKSCRLHPAFPFLCLATCDVC